MFIPFQQTDVVVVVVVTFEHWQLFNHDVNIFFRQFTLLKERI